MIVIKEVFIDATLVTYLKDRKLLSQYKKAERFLMAWQFQNIDLKLREPKEKGVWYFRINKQYRAFAFLEDEKLYIYEISDHSR